MAKATIPALAQIGQVSTPSTAPTTQLDLEDPAVRENVMKAMGIEEPRKQLSLFERITSVLDSLRFTDDIRKAQKDKNILSGVGDFLLDIPKGIAGAFTGNDYRDETDLEGGTEIIKNLGVKGPIANIGGFVLDVVGDAGTWVSLGTGAGAKILTGSGAKVLTESGTKVFNKFVREGVEDLAKSSIDDISIKLAKEGITDIANKTSRQIAEELATKKILDFSKKGVSVLKDAGIDETDKIVQQILKEGVFDKGGFKFAGKKLFDITPEVEKTLNLYFNPIKGVNENLKSIPIVGEKYAQGISKAGEGFSNLMQNASNTVRNLFDRKYNVTGGNPKFNPLYEFMQKSEDYLQGKSQDVVEQFTKEYKNIINAFEKPEILPYILEDTPIDKLKQLPKELQDSLTGALKQMQTEEEAYGAVERALKPREISEMNFPEEIQPLAELAKKTNSFQEFKRKVERAVKDGSLVLPDQLKLSNGEFDIGKFRTALQDGSLDVAKSEPYQANVYRFIRDGNSNKDVEFFTKQKDYAEAFQEELGNKGITGKITNQDVELRNPLIVNATTKEFSDPSFENPIIKKAMEDGHDGVIFRNGVDEFVARFNNVKSGVAPSILEEANKFSSADEFFLRMSKDTREALRTMNIKSQEAIKNFWTENSTPAEPILNSLNPTGISSGLSADYNPQARMEAKLGDNITTLDKTAGKSPDEIITIYRGAPSSQKEINPGDFITTNYDLANSYAGEGSVISKEVKASEILDDITEPLGEEYIYRPDVTKYRLKSEEKLPVSVMREFADFIDYAKGISKAPMHSGFDSVYDYEGAIRELAGKYNINAEMSNARLANKLSAILDKNEYGKTLTKSGGRLNAQSVLDMFKFRRLENELKKPLGRKLTDVEVEEIVNLNRKFFKDAKVGAVESILTPDGQEALGKYAQGWIDIASKQADPTDTFLHESVHKAIDLFIEKDRKTALFDFIKSKYNLIGLDAEEKIAEDFIKYAQGQKITVSKGIRKIFDDLLNFVKGIAGGKDEVQKLYDDILQGKLVRNSPEITEDFYKGLKETIGTSDPLKTQLNEIGNFKNIVDKTGVKRKVFEGSLSDTQIEFLKSKGIFTAQDLVDKAKSRSFYNLRSETVDVISKKTAPQMSRLQAGKEPVIQELERQIRILKTDPRFIALKTQYTDILADANATGETVVNLAEKLGGEDLVQEIKKYEQMRGAIEELNFKKQEKITELVNRTTATTIEKTGAFKPKASEFEEIANGLGIKPDKLKSVIENAKKSIKGTLDGTTKKADAEKLLSKVYEIKDPLQKQIITRNIERIANNTETMLEVGAISGTSTARYLGRDYITTPSGKNLEEEAKGLSGFFGKTIKSKLDPRSATSQKQRVYDYLADVIKEGGKTKLTETTGKEFSANLAEQLARDEMKAISATEFKKLGDAIIQKKLTDSGGNALFKTAKESLDILKQEGIKIDAKTQKAFITYQKTGKLPEQLKQFLKNKGYSQLTQAGGGVIPIFKDAFFDAETHDVLTKMHKQFFGQEEFNSFVKMYDKVQNAIKASQTSWFPAFHVRNMFSNVFTNFVEGVRNPQVYKDAQLIQKYNNVLEKIPLADVKESAKLTELLKEIGNKTIKLGDTGSYKISELHQLARYNGVISGGIYGDLSENLIKKDSLGIRSINPLSENFVVSQAGKKIGSSIEDNARIALFIDKMSKGWDIRSSALKVKEVLFDYSDLTDFEKNIMKRFVPYYTWTKKNAVVQMKRIVTQPGVYSAYLKGFKELQDAFSDLSTEDKAKLPDWAKKGAGIMFGIGDGNVSAIKQFGLPTDAFQSLLETNPLSTLGVLPKAVVEIGTGQNVFKGKAILDDTDGKAFRNFPQMIKDRMGYREEKRTNKAGKEYTVYYVDAWAKYYINMLLGRSFSEFSKISTIGGEGDAPADLLNLFTGMKKYDFNLTEEEAKRNRERSKKLYNELVNRGIAREYTNQYIPKEQKENILSRLNQ